MHSTTLAEEQRQRTTFFIGSNIMEWPLEAQRALTDGHEICVLTSSKAKTRSPSTSTRSMSSLILHGSAHSNLMPTCLQMKAIKLVTSDRICAITNVLSLQKIIWKYDSSDCRARTGSATPADGSSNYTQFIGNVASSTFNTVSLSFPIHPFSFVPLCVILGCGQVLPAAAGRVLAHYVRWHPLKQPHIGTKDTLLVHISGTTNKASGLNGSSSGGSSGSDNNGSSSSDAQEKSMAVARLAALVLLLAGAGMGLLASLVLRAATLDMVTPIPNTDTDTIPAISILRPDSPPMVA
ncbi:hypothetical protein EVG20_g9810 [Dentipellis fragilis]|uniref:Uncharacterized protein n=1 Tax=Dentipellis fragilis TaxID=205917 RepID=A0A4Y9XVM8_9AGAM|nr:hypothetical protein EVG20_g9810 [Dentipellis fragilis]